MTWKRYPYILFCIICLFYIVRSEEVVNGETSLDVRIHPSTGTPSLVILKGNSIQTHNGQLFVQKRSNDDLITRSMNLIDENKHLYRIESSNLKQIYHHFNPLTGETIQKYQQYKVNDMDQSLVEVIGGQLSFSFNIYGDVTYVSGTVIPEELLMIPSNIMSLHVLEKKVINFLLMNGQIQNVNDVIVISHEPSFYKKNLFESKKGAVHFADRIILQGSSNKHQEYEILVDFVTGDILNIKDRFNYALHRQIFMFNVSHGENVLIWSEEEETDKFNISSLLNASDTVYKIFKNLVEYDSYDGAGSNIKMNIIPMELCPNAFWSKQSSATFFCPDTADSIDIVAHELGHAYISYYGGDLHYEGESGALNEGFADIIGESSQLLIEDLPLRGLNETCEKDGILSRRWILGDHSLVSFAKKNRYNQLLGIRDMFSPECYGHPGSTFDKDLWCTQSDYKGVHSNSGVINKGYSLVVDGGYYNGEDIKGIGLKKALMIYVRALGMHTSSTNFETHALLLNKSCHELLESGTKIIDPLTGKENDQLASSDCESIEKMIRATGLMKGLSCNKTEPMILSGPSPLYLPYNNEESMRFSITFMTQDWDESNQTICKEWNLPDQKIESYYSSYSGIISCSSSNYPKTPYLNFTIHHGEKVFGPYIVQTYMRPKLIEVHPSNSHKDHPELLSLKVHNSSILREFSGCSKGLQRDMSPLPADFSYDCLVCDFGYEKTRAYLVGLHEVNCFSPKTPFEGERTLKLRLNRVDMGSIGIPFTILSEMSQDQKEVKNRSVIKEIWFVSLMTVIGIIIGVFIGVLVAWVYVKKKKRVTYITYQNEDHSEYDFFGGIQ